MTTKTFAVSGMKCVHCKANVENAVKAIDGVENAEACLEAQNVTVNFNDSKVTPDQIKEAIEASGRYELTEDAQ